MKALENVVSKVVDKLNIKIRKRQTIENLSAIYVGEKKETIMKRYLVEKLTLMSVLFILMLLITFLLLVSQKDLIHNGFIQRPDKGELEKEIRLQAEIDDKKIPIVFSLEEPRLQSDEIQKILYDASNTLEKMILNGNTDLNQVRTKLNLVRNIPNTKVSVKWESSNPLIIDYLGNVSNKELDRKGVKVTLMATLDYNSNIVTKSYEVKVFPPVLTEEEQLRIEILGKIAEEDYKNLYDSKIPLPTYIGEKQVKWREKSANKVINTIVLFLFILFAIYKLKDYQLEEKVKVRKRQMLLDYSEIVSKLSLLINAGLTTGAAIQKIAIDYSNKREGKEVKKGVMEETKKEVKKESRKRAKKRAKKEIVTEIVKGRKKTIRDIRYAYEELVLCCAGLNNGMTEQEVLEKFGFKCQMQEYLVLTSILNQNIKKGSAQMCQTLDELTTDAFLNKKAIAKILGEKASTKLLFPMMLLLIIVLLIVVVPTILSIKI